MGIETYVGKTLEASKYKRCKHVEIDNKLGTLPTITFSEEEVVRVEGLLPIQNACGSITEQLTSDNMNTSFPLLHPDTLQPLGGTMTYTDVSIAIRSLYAFLAARRDG